MLCFVPCLPLNSCGDIIIYCKRQQNAILIVYVARSSYSFIERKLNSQWPGNKWNELDWATTLLGILLSGHRTYACMFWYWSCCIKALSCSLRNVTNYCQVLWTRLQSTDAWSCGICTDSDPKCWSFLETHWYPVRVDPMWKSGHSKTFC